MAVTVSDQAADLALSGAAPLGIEVYGALQKGSLFERVFGLELRVDGHASGSDGL